MKEEERRFLREIIPGLVFIIELSIVLLLILCESQICEIICFFSDNISIPILVLIGSGGIGYFLGILYRFFYWIFFPLNSWGILESFLKENKLDLRISKPMESECFYFSRYGAWRIINVIFYSRIKESKCFSGAEGRNDRLVDYMHSSGTIFIGYIAAIIIGIIYILFNSLQLNPIKIIILIFLIIALFLIHFISYQMARNNTLNFLKCILLNEFQNYKTKKNKELRIYIVNEDLSEKVKFIQCQNKINMVEKRRRRRLKISYNRKIILYPEN